MLNTMRRRGAMVLTGLLLLHAAAGGGGAWLAHRAHAERAAPAPKPVFAGETFDVSEALEPPAPAPAVAAPAPTEAHAPEAAEPRLRQSPAASSGERARTATAPQPLLFGALGNRSATSLVVAVARAFPQAASTDPVWRTVPLGGAGAATLEIELERDGTVARYGLGPGASPALRQAVVRTMAFLGERPFVARGAVTRLHLTARVTADAVRDGSDAVYAIHSEHDGDHGSAFFSLASGRRVDLAIRVETAGR